MAGARPRSAGLAGLSTLLLLLLPAPARAAGSSVTIQYDVDAHAEVAESLASELAIEGYAVELDPTPEPTPCDADGVVPASSVVVPKAWIRLSDAASGDDSVVASICYLGALPLLQTAAPSAPRAEPRRLAVATAEALNGLRSKVPGRAEGTASEAGRHEPAAVAPRAATPAPPPPESTRSGVSLALGGTALANTPDLPLTPGASLDAALGVSPWFAIHLSGLVPLGGAGVESPAVTASVRTAWLRFGPRAQLPLGDVGLSVAVLFGPAVTWATAVAREPRVGKADVSPGAVVSFAAMVEYPRDSVIFARASASVSALVPGVRVELWSGEPRPEGKWPLEGTVGLGARWGH